MQVINNLDFQLNNTAVCIGKFDGLHRGHRLLLSEAGQGGYTVTMITFSFPDGRGIYSCEEKVWLAEKLGVEVLISIPVTEEFMRMSAEDFVKKILVERCDAKKVVVGADFGFGYHRSGNAEFLREAGIDYGFDTFIYEKLMQDGEVISSTRIRGLLREGRMVEVNDLLGTPYFVRGVVKKGNQIGRTMGVPTANIEPDEMKELPPYGVYTVRLEIAASSECSETVQYNTYDGIANLGVKPTIGDDNRVTLEVWLFDFEGDLYDKELIVYLLDFQRPERKFESLEELKEQIDRDIEVAKKYID